MPRNPIDRESCEYVAEVIDTRFRDFWRDMTIANRSPSLTVRAAFRKLLKANDDYLVDPRLKWRIKVSGRGSHGVRRRRKENVIPFRPRAA